MEELLLPPGFDEQKLQQVLRALTAALGADKVFVEEADRAGYHDKFAIDDTRHLPLAAISPETVEEVQARATIIRTYDRRRVVVPNADLFTKSVIVNTAFPQRRMIYELTVAGDLDPERVKVRLSEALRGIEGVEKDPVADALLTKIAGDSMTFRILYWARSDLAEFAKVQDRVLIALRGALRADGVKIV